ncbi:hypothetical protein [Sphingobium sp. Cam5-1]|uniref:hypothetical protein n=1 Tax=Sphingobium sp. Cam5-1 TaxID=2789327 RepID=UPI0018AD2EE2|nr:hypothetical protein [Sphingobium sp. Cam5-1]QPI73260.1 hypothetical protein IZV00_01695 [Sphingobium sp. Cam5-1]
MDTFWKWFAKGSGSAPPGYRNVFNGYILVHGIVAILATFFINSDPFMFAGKALFPAASILIGLSMAWTTRASTILQSKELREALFASDRPAEDYVYGFQLAILVVMLMVILVAVMAGGGLKISLFASDIDRALSGFWMYFTLSLALRECWGVINFTNMLSMLEYRRATKP